MAVEHATTITQVASPGVMITFAVGMLLTYVGVAHEKFHKTVAALAGALVLIVLAKFLIPGFEYPHIYEWLAHDLNVLGVIIGTGILVDVTGKSGLFHFLGMLIVRKTGGQALKLYLALCVLSFVFVAVLTIVPAMLILTSLVLVICRSLKYESKPFLLGAAICANSGAIVTFASGLPNIMIGTAAKIPYVQFLMVSAPYAVVSLVIAMILMRLLFRKNLPWKQDDAEKERLKNEIAEFDPWALVKSKAVLIRSGIILGLTVIGFALAQLLGLGMDYIAIAGGTAALLFAGKSVEETIHKVNWTVILFFVGLFLIIGCVKASGALTWLAQQVVAVSGDDPVSLIALLTVFSAVASSFVDNIPVAATLIPIVQDITGMGFEAEPLWWSLVLGCNLGGNGTPIGSISCVIAIHALHKEEGIHVGWGEFFKLGGVIMLFQVVGAVGYLLAINAASLFPAL